MDAFVVHHDISLPVGSDGVGAGARRRGVRSELVSGLSSVTTVAVIGSLRSTGVPLVTWTIDTFSIGFDVGVIAKVKTLASTLGNKHLKEVRDVLLVLEKDLAEIFGNVVVPIIVKAAGKAGMTNTSTATWLSMISKQKM